MQLLKAPKAVLREGKLLLRDAKQIGPMVLDPKLARSYYPGEKRKSKSQILRDLLAYFIRHREINTYYYVYGFDRQNGVNKDQYLPYRVFRKIRNARNLHPRNAAGYNYVCLLRDKFVFSQFVASLGFPTPRNVAICNETTITWLDHMRSTPLETVLHENERQFDGFCKPLEGINGRGAFPLRLAGGKLFVNNDEITLEQLRERLGEGGQFLIQERVRQIAKMNELHPESINTVRVITFNNKGNVQAFSAAQRIGTQGRSLDNWTAGGILVGVDLETGRLRADGIYKPGYGGIVQEHPQTRVRFLGWEILQFHATVELVTNLHRYLYGVHSIGWDIAITENGPIIIEGNDDWDGAVPMAVEQNFKQRFLQMYRS